MLNLLGMGVSALGGILGNRSANRARRAQEQAMGQAMGFQNQALQGFQPYAQAGQENLNRLNALMGGDYSGFMNAPDYRAAQEMGLKQLDRSAAARGALYSGGADADRIRFGSQLATQNLGNYRNALAGLAGMGQQAAGSMANVYGNMGEIATGIGQARAQNAGQVGANNLNMLNNMWGFGSDWLGGRSLSKSKGGG